MMHIFIQNHIFELKKQKKVREGIAGCYFKGYGMLTPMETCASEIILIKKCIQAIKSRDKGIAQCFLATFTQQ